MRENYFAFKDEEYKRYFNPIQDYVDIQTFFLSRMTNKPESECGDFIRNNLKEDGLLKINNRKVKYLSREEQIDRVRKQSDILEYITAVRKNNYIMSPAWTCYVPSTVKESMYTGFIDEKSKIRSAYKKALFIAEQKNDESAISFNDGMQSSAKIDINSISGASVQSVTINHTQSLHSTLTSICAASTSHANLNNEKLIAGNRLYTSYQAVLDNICAISLRADLDALQLAMDEFNIVYPSTEDVLDCIKRSTDNYWLDDVKFNKLRIFVDKLTPLEKAAFVYIGDLYHLDKLNPSLVEDFLNGFSKRTYEEYPNPEEYHTKSNVDTDVEILAKLICKDYLMGKTMEELKSDFKSQYAQVVSNMKMVNDHLDKYKNLIKGVFRPNFLNPGVSSLNMKTLVRKVVLTSDTDSTIFTAQYWVKRITNSIGFEDKHYNVGFVISFLANKTVYHQLALMSKNIGLEIKNLHGISMKNEFYFPVYSLTNSAKNYFAYKSVREGNVYPKMKLEKKGVELRTAKVPKNVMSQFDNWIMYLMDLIIEKQSITIDELFKPAYLTETQVMESIKDGKAEYFQTANIKMADSYKLGNDAPALFYHRLWEQVFAPKYGYAPPLPYVALKVSTKVMNRTQLIQWLESIKDVELKQRLELFLKQENKHSLPVLYAPKLTIGKHTLPEEIRSIIDVDKQVMNVTSPYYAVLEAFGYYLKNDKLGTMIYNYYKPAA